MTIVSQNNFKSLFPYIDNEEICRYDEEFCNLIVVFMYFAIVSPNYINLKTKKKPSVKHLCIMQCH